jgi:hypothetical protein
VSNPWIGSPVSELREKSLRQIANDCLGISGEFQVVRDFFGYATGAPEQVSLLRQLNLLDAHVNISIVRVGIESFTEGDEREIDAAVAFMRETYASVSIGVGAVERYYIATADAGGRDHIADDDEAEELTHEWSTPYGSIDVFFVRSYAGSGIGSAPREGPEDKDKNGPMTGVVLAVEGSTTVTGFALAWLVGCYLGLKTSDNSNNLMFETVPNGGNLTRDQGEEMMDSGLAYFGCAPWIRF